MGRSNAKQTCAWCRWRYSANGHTHRCEALACPQTALRGCHCVDCSYRTNNQCPLASGMKEKTEWCECRLEYVQEKHPATGLDSVCALFEPIDFNSYRSRSWHPAAVKRAAALNPKEPQ